MAGTVTGIERVTPRPGDAETPALAGDGRFKLADPSNGKEKHHAKHMVYARTLDEVADLLARGFSLWMTKPGKRPSLISPESLRILRK
ncbi:hypothetical protein [Hansschlegelia beijingensis]|uniref:Uncharacterized protein n=1 Tax=Hansschlegelia beijingensis TaxID=1133344 RepID=A0A7W6CZS4_9HYPH|nr:hypothetical protein [Hansschlegelia beijingensis]MBB3974110.1 hypothetical protein [Hansschlegelia beijingensis]